MFYRVVIQTFPYYLCLPAHPSFPLPSIYFYLLVQNESFWAFCGQQFGHKVSAYSRLINLWINCFEYKQKHITEWNTAVVCKVIVTLHAWVPDFWLPPLLASLSLEHLFVCPCQKNYSPKHSPFVMSMEVWATYGRECSKLISLQNNVVFWFVLFSWISCSVRKVIL